MVDVAQRIIELIAEQLDKDVSEITPRCLLLMISVRIPLTSSS